MKKHHSKRTGRKPHPSVQPGNGSAGASPSHQASTIPRDYPAPICRALAEEIRAQRVARGLSCYAVAKLAHLARETVYVIERKRLLRKLDTAARISDVFGMDLGLLVSLAARRC